jgi:hydrogenase expression/formation protein HypE
MADGSGGKETWRLLNEVFFPVFSGPNSDDHHDGAVFGNEAGDLAMATDSFVVRPHFFPGGDIGKLAVFGTVNDLAMCGARPKALSMAFIIEEGFPVQTLREVVQSIGSAAAEVNVKILTGDTKVVEKGKGDGLFITSTGIGVLQTKQKISPNSIQPGDSVILSGDLGRHAIAILAAREELSFESEIQSDCGSLLEPVMKLLSANLAVHCLRDLTRGGLSAALNEIAGQRNLTLMIQERQVLTSEPVQSACEMLGFDPMQLANEGRFICILPSQQSAMALEILRKLPITQDACVIGEVLPIAKGRVELETILKTRRLVEMPSGNLLPRIC